MGEASPEVQRALTTDLTIDITTIGRRSGKPRRIEIWFLNVDGRVYITGTPGPRDWFANVSADPNIVFHLKESVQADLPAVATVVNIAAERRRVCDATASRWYIDNSSLEAMVQTAPMVRVNFVGS
ncbi:MAG: nitroreductase family deazaflavin-dependent oxidoreductase [Actinomycetia bacterium]|nr:nitroreductase family deazaflavin-dependent oxidoreductase [Actinomycetes bacterium]MCP4961597.1 nitroreductase family deazaflavin-dependent oxidoreductase [Actinomycetes bacterium]